MVTLVVKAFQRWRQKGWPMWRRTAACMGALLAARHVQFGRLPCSIAETFETAVQGEGDEETQLRSGFYATKRSDSESVSLQYYISEPTPLGSTFPPDVPPRIVVITNGIGVNIWFWKSILAQFHTRGWKIVAWEYAGMFESDASHVASESHRFAISEHSADLAELLEHLKVPRADLMLGWSLGVTVALDFAIRYPALVDKLFLINGTHGEAAASMLQPAGRLLPLRGVHRALFKCILNNTATLRPFVAKCWPMREYLKLLIRPWSLLSMQRRLEDFTVRYGHDNLHTEHKASVWFRTGLDFDSYSAYALLPTIKHRTFIVSGFWDFLAPAFCSAELVARMPNAVLHCYATGTHFVLFEHPALLLDEIFAFGAGSDE